MSLHIKNTKAATMTLEGEGIKNCENRLNEASMAGGRGGGGGGSASTLVDVNNAKDVRGILNHTSEAFFV